MNNLCLLFQPLFQQMKGRNSTLFSNEASPFKSSTGFRNNSKRFPDANFVREIFLRKQKIENRKQFCSLNGQQSKAKDVTCGIPQGSCLGPLLFIIYLNDFEKCLKFSWPSIYADDTSITTASDDVAKLVEDAHQELSNLSEWMRVNKLSLNPKKTEFIIIGHPLKTKNLELPEVRKLNNSDIKRVDKTKSLGVIVDEKPNWEQF